MAQSLLADQQSRQFCLPIRFLQVQPAGPYRLQCNSHTPQPQFQWLQYQLLHCTLQQLKLLQLQTLNNTASCIAPYGNLSISILGIKPGGQTNSNSHSPQLQSLQPLLADLKSQQRCPY